MDGNSNTKISRNFFQAYWPLLALVLIAALAAYAISFGIYGDFQYGMHYFMGFLFCQFSMLKIFNIRGFVDGFQMYDLIAKKFRAYAYAYTFIELGLGLAYLSFFSPALIYLFTIFITAIGTLGVIIALKKGLDVRCACMGTVLNVPLSTVTLSEDIGMGLMAVLMLIFLV